MTVVSGKKKAKTRKKKRKTPLFGYVMVCSFYKEGKIMKCYHLLTLGGNFTYCCPIILCNLLHLKKFPNEAKGALKVDKANQCLRKNL